MDPKTGVIFNDEQGEFGLKLSMMCGAWRGKNREPQTSVDVWVLIESFD